MSFAAFKFVGDQLILVSKSNFIAKYDEAQTLDDDGLGGTKTIVKNIETNNYNPDKDWKKLTNVALGYSSDDDYSMEVHVEDHSYGITIPGGSSIFKNIQAKFGFKIRGKRFKIKIVNDAENFELFDVDMKIAEVPQDRMYNNG